MEQAWPFARWRITFLGPAILSLLFSLGCQQNSGSEQTADRTTAASSTVPATPASDSAAPPPRESSSVGESSTAPPVSSSAPSESAAPPSKSAALSSKSAATELPSETTEPTDTAQRAASEEPSKPNQERVELFAGWPKPIFVFLVTGQQMGYLEPCGCTGLANQKGGLARRHTLARQMSDRGWPMLAMDAGNQIHRFGRQSEIKFQVTAEALKKIGYQAIAFGVDDLRLSSGELAAVVLANDGGTTPFVCANAAVIDRALTPTHHIIEVGGKKIGITAVLGGEYQSKIIGGDVIVTSPDEGLQAVLQELKAAKCDFLVLLSHASDDESKKFAQKYPDFRVVVSAGVGVGEPEYQPELIGDSKTIFIKVGAKGMFAGVLGCFDDPKMPWRFQRVPLDDRFQDSPDMLAMLASYQEQLKTLGFDGLGLKPIVHPSGHEFVGSDKCGECHTKAYEKWQSTPHSHATDSLIHPPERGEIARHFDPECLSCHVTGWNPQKYFPYSSGFLSLEKTPLRVGSGCENCHGPGSAHVAAELGEGNPKPETLSQLRAAMRLPLAKAETKCLECHDLDNSPDFHETGAFQKYWQKVEHKGLD